MNLTKQDRVSLQNLLGHFVHLTPEDAPIMPELKRLRDLVTPQKVGRKVGWRKPIVLDKPE